MKQKGRLSQTAFASLSSGFENRLVSGMDLQNTRYLQPHHIERLTKSGYLDLKGVTSVEGVLSHYLRYRNRSGLLSSRIYSLSAVFLANGGMSVRVLPTDWFLANSDDEGEEEPKMKECTYDVCMTRGQVSTCERKTASIPENEECVTNAGCPNSPCSNGGANVFSIDTILGS
jgi:hypothetical protein